MFRPGNLSGSNQALKKGHLPDFTLHWLKTHSDTAPLFWDPQNRATGCPEGIFGVRRSLEMQPSRSRTIAHTRHIMWQTSVGPGKGRRPHFNASEYEALRPQRGEARVDGPGPQLADLPRGPICVAAWFEPSRVLSMPDSRFHRRRRGNAPAQSV